MADIDYDACYATLQLEPGGSLKEVNQAWRRLSRIHHPDQHARDPKAHRQALEKQKQINNARDFLKRWFEQNPNVVPPRTQAPSAYGKKGTDTSSQNARCNRQGSSQSRTGNSHSTSYSEPNDQCSKKQAKETERGWFKASEFKLSPLQQLVYRLATQDKLYRSDASELIRIGLGLAAVFGPMWLVGSATRMIFPDMGHDIPDWLQMLMVFLSGYCTYYLFRWFFAESDIIKMQEKTFYFRTNRPVSSAIEYAKLLIGKCGKSAGAWEFSAKDGMHNAALEYEEAILPDWKSKRHISVRFAAKSVSAGSVLAMEIRVSSPVNSFSCNKLSKAIIEQLRKEMHELPA